MAILAMQERGRMRPPRPFAMALPAITPSRARCPCHAHPNPESRLPSHESRIPPLPHLGVECEGLIFAGHTPGPVAES